MNDNNWAVIGAGVAGITAVAKLLDKGVEGNNVHWICPDFEVGDLGRKWRNVSGNTSVKRVKDFLLGSAAFELENKQSDFAIFSMNEEDTCYLRDIVEPLEWSTSNLMRKVNTYKNKAEKIDSCAGGVQVTLCNNQKIYTNKVIVAIGCEPKKALYKGIKEIALEKALDPSKLTQEVGSNDIVGVFGSSHSAALILKALHEIGVKKIVNFYLEDLVYAEDTGKGIMHDNTGLKGIAATWAKQYLEDGRVSNLVRIRSDERTIAKYLPQMNKVVYSIGFDRRKLEIDSDSARDYDKTTGQIIKNVYGFGIAYPCVMKDLSGQDELQVGVAKFMKQLDVCLDNWGI